MDLNQFTQLFNIRLEESKVVKIGKNYYFSDERLQELRSKIDRDVYSLGLYLGSDDGKLFSASPALIEMLSKMDLSGSRKVYVNDKAEGLFLYGRNVLKESISRNPNNITTGYVFVQNEKDENLGFGIYQTQGDQVIIKNLLDKGTYLRGEAKKRRKH